MEKESLIKKAYDLGFDYEKKYRGCSQCTIASVQDTLGIRNDYVFKAASGFPAGCGLLGDGICGGYTSGIMSMSLFFEEKEKNLMMTVKKITVLYTWPARFTISSYRNTEQ